MMLRYQGKMFTLACKADNWVEDNYEELFEDPSVRKNLLKLKLSNPKRMEWFKASLDATDKGTSHQKELFKQVLKEYAISELVLPKIRNLMYKQKMMISSCLHPTNEYQFRQKFIEA